LRATKRAKVFWFFFSKNNTSFLFAPHHRLMRPIWLCVFLAACHPAATPVVALGAVEASSVAVFGRGGFDMAYSALSGRDCSIVRLDKGESYCRPKDAPPPAPRFCTRTLGAPECFADPAFLPDHPAPLADGPSRLTPAQEKSRTSDWP
jgi:hypothetical protein